MSGKAIATLSFLFGLGFAVQMMRAQARGVSALPLYCRRLAVMFAIGLAHTIFLWYGDILRLYATLGFVLIVFARRSDRTVLATAGILLIALPLAMGIWMTIAGLTSTAPAAPPAGPSRAEINAATLAIFQSGSYLQMVRENVTRALQFYQGAMGLAQLEYLGLFLLGLYVGRRRVFEDVAAHERTLRRVAV